ncbi:MAG: L,D-transpeptidase [Methyloceanibacter sp.]
MRILARRSVVLAAAAIAVLLVLSGQASAGLFDFLGGANYQPQTLSRHLPAGPSPAPSSSGSATAALIMSCPSKERSYIIQGIDAPWTAGQEVSHGCIWMLNEDVSDLYQRVPVGTKLSSSGKCPVKVLASFDKFEAKIPSIAQFTPADIWDLFIINPLCLFY